MGVLSSPFTLLALAFIALGLAAWWWRSRLSGLAKLLRGVGRLAADGYGFERINQAVVDGAQTTGEALRVTQTGQLNWNVAAIILGLVAVLIFLILGAAL